MDFFYKPDTKTFKITPQHEEVIRNLNFKIEKGGDYYDCQPRWALKDNEMLDGISFKDIYKAMQFITMTADIQGDVPNHFKGLLRRTYIDHYETNHSMDGESIVLGFKRPFGNSHVIGDVREEMIRGGYYAGKIDEDFDDNNNYELEEIELRKFIDFLTTDFFRNFTIKYKAFLYKDRLDQGSRNIGYEYWESKLDVVHSYLLNWILDPAEVRNEKLEKILN